MNINFDLDGTLVDFYSVDGWLNDLQTFNPRPYEVARPLCNLAVLARMLHKLQAMGYTLNIISWLSKNSNEAFDEAVTVAKLAWLKKHLPSVKWDNISIVAYGTPKSTCGTGILFDDEERNRNEWGANAFDADKIFQVLKQLN